MRGTAAPAVLGQRCRKGGGRCWGWRRLMAGGRNGRIGTGFLAGSLTVDRPGAADMEGGDPITALGGIAAVIDAEVEARPLQRVIYGPCPRFTQFRGKDGVVPFANLVPNPSEEMARSVIRMWQCGLPALACRQASTIMPRPTVLRQSKFAAGQPARQVEGQRQGHFDFTSQLSVFAGLGQVSCVP